MKEGDIKFWKETCVSKECENCGETATKRITFLIEGNARSNPASSAYGRDDCSWCSDAEAFSCDKCAESTRRNPPRGFSWCATFIRDKFDHMFLEWRREEVKEVSTTLTT